MKEILNIKYYINIIFNIKWYKRRNKEDNINMIYIINVKIVCFECLIYCMIVNKSCVMFEIKILVLIFFLNDCLYVWNNVWKKNMFLII